MKNSSINPLIAGGAAGAIETIITYPTEFIKTKLQLQTQTKIFKGPLDCILKTVKNHGFFSLYKGLSPMIIGTTAKASVRFLSYDNFKRLLSDDNGKLTPLHKLLAGLGAGVTEAVFVVTPTETIKTKFIQDQGSSNPKFNGLIHGVTQIIKSEGIFGIYQGLTTVILRQGANQAVRLTSYEILKDEFIKRRKIDRVHWTQTFCIGMIAGIITVYTTMPIDVLKTKMQSINSSYRSTLHCAIYTFKNEGILSFWKGATPRLSRLILSGGIVFTVYEQVMLILKKL